MRITKFSQITAQLPYPPKFKGTLQSIHSTIIQATIDKGRITRKEGKNIVNIINTVSYRLLNEEDTQWSQNDPLMIHGEPIDEDIMQSFLGIMYVAFKNIDWSLDDIEISASETPAEPHSTPTPVSKMFPAYKDPQSLSKETPKEDLYIQPPVVPQFNHDIIYASAVIDDCAYTIYASLPDIPTKQNEISVTTDVSKMSRKDLLRLYPNRRIQTRATAMYEQYSGQEYHPIVGTIFPISGFTRDEILDNIVKYPHLFKLNKTVDAEVVPFYNTIEIDGTLHKISDIWATLPESEVIPFNREFVKEYVVRRYLLERDVKKIQHVYPLTGALDPFLTLFTTPDEYAQLGYEDAEALARSCVEARVAYKHTRNPVLRRIEDA